MTYLIVLAALAFVPVLAIMLLRVNAAIAFMSLCLGSVLVSYTSPDITTIAGSLSPHGSFDKSWVRLGLLLVPFLFTILFARRSVKGTKQLLNLLPALSAGLLCALLVVPLLPDAMRQQVHHQALWTQLDNLQTGVILAGAVFSLFFLLISHRKKRNPEEEAKKGKH